MATSTSSSSTSRSSSEASINANETNEADSTGKSEISPRQWAILSVLMTATLTSSLAVCLFPPFFPRIAEEKGFSGSVYGPIIGTNCLTSFIVTPFIGKHVRFEVFKPSAI